MTNLDEIAEAFDLLGDWDQRYQYLIELGEKLTPMPDEYKVDDNKVKGCMSQVWVYAYPDQVDVSKLHYYGESDTSVIKGVLALIIQLLDMKTAEEIKQLDMDELFERLDLHEHLSPNRHVGIYAIVDLMKQQAHSLKSKPVTADKIAART